MKPSSPTSSKARQETDAWLIERWKQQTGEIAALRRDKQRMQAALDAARELLRGPELAALRAQAIDSLRSLLPIAIARAKAKRGSPALLRLLLRSLKTL